MLVNVTILNFWSCSIITPCNDFTKFFISAYPPKIEEILETIESEDLKLILDIALPYPMSLEIVVDYVTNEIFGKNKNFYSKIIITSSWPHVIYAIRHRDPKIVSGLVVKPNLLRLTFPKSYSTWNHALLHYCAWLGDILLSWATHDFLWYFLGKHYAPETFKMWS